MGKRKRKEKEKKREEKSGRIKFGENEGRK